MKNFFRFLIIVLLATFSTQTLSAADWGSLKGRFVFDGKAGEPKAINVNKDIEFCSKHKLVEEKLVVGEKSELRNVFVYLYLKRGKSVEIHPELAKSGEKPAVLDNKGCRFEPHALLVRTKQPFEVTNSDEGIGHNTKVTFRANVSFNETVPNDKPLKRVFEKTEPYPVEMGCNIHPWMTSYVLVRDNPYMAISDAKGNFVIKNIPAGKHEFVFWHEGKGGMRDLKVGESKTSRKGRAKLEIKADETLDLGEIKVPAAVLGL